MVNVSWETTTLGKVATLQRGYDLPHRLRKPGRIPIITSSGIGDTHSTAMIAGPGVVTGRYGTIGKVFYIDRDFWPLNTTLYVRDFHGNDPLFVSYLLRTIDFHSHSGKSGVPGVNRNDLHQLTVEVPPTKTEQVAIAEVLSDLDSLIGALDKLIDKKRDLKQAVMQELLTGKKRLSGFRESWKEVMLGELGKCYRGVSYNPGLDLSTFDKGSTVRLLRSNNVQAAKIVFTDMQYVDSRRVSLDQRLRTKDVLICMANGNRDLVGKAAPFSECDGFEYTFGAFMGCFRPNHQRVDCNFVFYLFQTANYRLHIAILLAGSSINNLTPTSVESLVIQIPTEKAEQTAIATVLSSMEAEIASLEQKCDKTRALKQGMMQELLTGKTRLV